MPRSNRPASPADAARLTGAVVDTLVLAPAQGLLRGVSDPAQAASQVRDTLREARTIGEFVVRFGAARLRQRFEESASSNDDRDAGRAGRHDERPSPPGDGNDRAATDNEPAATDRGRPPIVLRADPATTARAATDEVDGDDSDDDGPSADDLALVDYDQLPAIDIVSRLADLDPGERALIGEYERRNRRRRTVLGKIAQLDG